MTHERRRRRYRRHPGNPWAPTAEASHYSLHVPALDWSVIRTAALGGLFVVLPAAVLAELIVGEGGSGAWASLFFLITLFGFATAGFGAGRVRSDTPMIHGAAAAVACYAVVQVFGIAARVLRGADINPLTYPLTALLAGLMGVCGALFADWYRRRSLRAG